MLSIPLIEAMFPRQAEQERLAKLSNNPFGAAKPREAILAIRTGKTEEEILKEAVKAERLKLRLNAEQLEEKKALEVGHDTHHVMIP